MKKTFLALFLGASMFYYSCETRPGATDDSVTRAQEINEERFEDVDEELAQDAELLTELASANMMKWQLSEEAAERATNERVKKFAEKVASDHKELHDELQELAAQKNITLPLDVSEEHRNTMNDVIEADEEDFDQDYLNEIARHSSDYAADLEDLVENASDEEIREWASKALFTFRQHENKASKLQEKIDDNGGLFDIFEGDDEEERDRGEQEDMDEQDTEDEGGWFEGDNDQDNQDDNRN